MHSSKAKHGIDLNFSVKNRSESVNRYHQVSFYSYHSESEIFVIWYCVYYLIMKFINLTDMIILQILTFIILTYINKIAFDRRYPLS